MSNLVLVPGFMCNECIWQYRPEKLNKKFKIKTPSLLHGNSIEEFSISIAKTLPDDSSILGFSMGGFIALKLAIDFPEKVKKLILVGTNAISVSNERKNLLIRSLKFLKKKKLC